MLLNSDVKLILGLINAEINNTNNAIENYTSQIDNNYGFAHVKYLRNAIKQKEIMHLQLQACKQNFIDLFNRDNETEKSNYMLNNKD